MKFEKILMHKLHTMGLYGSRTISVYALIAGIKGITLQEFEDSMIILFNKGFVIISNAYGEFRISLNPKKKEEVLNFIK